MTKAIKKYVIIGSMGIGETTRLLGVCSEEEMFERQTHFRQTWRQVKFNQIPDADTQVEISNLRIRQDKLLKHANYITGVSLLSLSAMKSAVISQAEKDILKLILKKMQQDNNIRIQQVTKQLAGLGFTEYANESQV